jgi:hypothetical protein
VIARLNAECDKALADKAVRDALFKAATEPVGGEAERLGKLARADSEKYAAHRQGSEYQAELMSSSWPGLSRPSTTSPARFQRRGCPAQGRA